MKNIITAAIIAMAAAPAMADESSTDRCHKEGMLVALIAEKRDEGIPLTDMLEMANDLAAGVTDIVLAIYENRDITPSKLYTSVKDGCELKRAEQSK